MRAELVLRSIQQPTAFARIQIPRARSTAPAQPDAERQFAQRMGADTIEVASGHCAMVSHPEETHERIVTAANAAAVPE